MKHKEIDLGKQLRDTLQEREQEFKKFFVKTVSEDPILKKMWAFCFEKDLLRKDSDEFYDTRLNLLKQRHISKSDFFHLNKLASSAEPNDKIFYDIVRLYTYITARVIIHKWKTEEAGYNIPIEKLYSAQSTFQRIITDQKVTEINHFSLPDFIEEYTRTTDDEGGIFEDICLIWLLPVYDKRIFIQYLKNYFENYTVQLLQESPHSKDISFGNASFVRLHETEPGRYNKKEDSTHRYSISLELNGNRQKLIDCSLGEKYKPLLYKMSNRLSYLFKKLSHYDLEWVDASQEVYCRFYELLEQYSPEKDVHLAGYLEKGLKYFCGHRYEKLAKTTKDPGKGFYDRNLGDLKYAKENRDFEADPINFPIDPETKIIRKQNEVGYQKSYQKIREKQSPETKRFLEIWRENPDKTESKLADRAGISKPMVKKHKLYIKQKTPKRYNPFKNS